jgi:DNA-binding NarL/FixJ family response regulator
VAARHPVDISPRRLDGGVLVALAARDHLRLRRLAAALRSAGIDVGPVLRPEQGVAEDLAAGANVVACACDPFRAHQAADVRRLRGALPAIALLLVAGVSRDPAAVVRRALSLGADGVVLEQDVERTLGPTVVALAGGQITVPRAGRRYLQRPQLSHREKQVVSLAVSGHTNAEIGAHLYLAESTVKSHLTAAFRRLGVASRREAAALLLDPEEGLGSTVLGGADFANPEHAWQSAGSS